MITPASTSGVKCASTCARAARPLAAASAGCVKTCNRERTPVLLSAPLTLPTPFQQTAEDVTAHWQVVQLRPQCGQIRRVQAGHIGRICIQESPSTAPHLCTVLTCRMSWRRCVTLGCAQRCPAKYSFQLCASRLVLSMSPLAAVMASYARGYPTSAFIYAVGPDQLVVMTGRAMLMASIAGRPQPSPLRAAHACTAGFATVDWQVRSPGQAGQSLHLACFHQVRSWHARMRACAKPP